MLQDARIANRDVVTTAKCGDAALTLFQCPHTKAGSGGSGGTSSSSRATNIVLQDDIFKPGRSHYCKVCGDTDSTIFQ